MVQSVRFSAHVACGGSDKAAGLWIIKHCATAKCEVADGGSKVLYNALSNEKEGDKLKSLEAGAQDSNA
jgi:hypothetical protein